MTIFFKALVFVSPLWLISFLFYLETVDIGILVFLALPGIFVSMMISGNVHYQSMPLVLIANIIIYYLLVLSILYICRRRARMKTGMNATPI